MSEGQKPRRTYTMSEAALAQRRANVERAAAAATGPRTEEGKAASSRNAWKHGLYSVGTAIWRELGFGLRGKPCKTTCSKYPCELVESGATREGGDCLDRAVYLEAFDALMDTMHSGEVAHAHPVLAAQMAQAVELLQELRETIAEKGLLVTVPIVTKSGEIVGEKSEPNPLIFHYTKMLQALGINFAELLATPQSVKKIGEQENAANAVAALFGQALARSRGPVRRPTIIPAQARRLEE